jgi:hypothetical protein
VAERVVLHIGLMKSGTTFVQGFLGAHRARLRDHDVLFPGKTWSDQVQAIVDFMGYDVRRTARTEGAWQRLREEIEARPGTAVVSMEFLAAVKAVNIERFVAEFDGTPTEVVVTARDLGRNLPAMWQEGLKNGRAWTWREYLDGVRDGGPAGRHFWRQQAAGKIVAKWADAVGAERTTVVTLPPRGAPRDLLWRRFTEALRLPALADWELPPAANESLGAASSQVMRRLNEQLPELRVPTYQRVVKGVLANRVLASNKSAEQPIGFKVEPWLARRAETIRRRIEECGVHVVGTLDDLVPQDVPGVEPDDVPDHDIAEAAMAAIRGMVLRQVDREAGGEGRGTPGPTG